MARFRVLLPPPLVGWGGYSSRYDVSNRGGVLGNMMNTDRRGEGVGQKTPKNTLTSFVHGPFHKMTCHQRLRPCNGDHTLPWIGLPIAWPYIRLILPQMTRLILSLIGLNFGNMSRNLENILKRVAGSNQDLLATKHKLLESSCCIKGFWIWFWICGTWRSL